MMTGKTFSALFFIVLFFVPFTASAQITIGSGNQPSPWSLLDLEALPLPDQERAKGLMIFNLFNNCLEFWNGGRWISLCGDMPQIRCGAYIAPGVWREFMCHNLGADYDLDPFTPHSGLHGAMFKWGTGIPSLTAQENIDMTPYISGNPWGDRGNAPPNGALPDGVFYWNMQTANPCPQGFRVPTDYEWQGVIENNSWTYIYHNDADDLYAANDGRFDTGIKIGTNLFLPAVGARADFCGHLFERGIRANYWSMNLKSWFGNSLYFNLLDAEIDMSSAPINTGFSVRCIAE